MRYILWFDFAKLFVGGVFIFLVGCAANNTNTSASHSSISTETSIPTGKELVILVQNRLLSKGYNLGPADGVMGQKTTSAISAYQSDNNLPATGSIDNATYYSLMGAETTQAAPQQAEKAPSMAAMIGSQFVDALFAQAGVKPPPKSTTGGSSSGEGTSKNSSSGSVAEQEAAKRKELSRNHASVNFQVPCPDLFIPEVYEKKYKNMIPVYAMVVLNNSTKRYSVQYDLVYEESTAAVHSKTVFGTTVGGRKGYSETTTETKNFTVRPGTLTEFLLIEKSQRSGAQISGITAVDVFKCTSP